MDFLKKAQKSFSGSSSKPADPAATAPAGTAAPADKQDYGDKAADFMSKKAGVKMDRGTQEKVTDGARGFYEKFTGKKVDPKYSS